MMMKSKIKTSHVVMLLLLLSALLFITPLLSSSLRQTFLYFIMNLLIIGLGAEAGLLKAFSNPLQDPPQDTKATTTHIVVDLAPKLPSPQASQDCNITIDDERKKVKVVEKSKSEMVIGAVKILEIVKKCPSLPSIFFIGGDDDDDQDEDDHVVAMEAEEEEEEEEEDVGGGDLSGQELFTKADVFIGNFYKQRKDSYNKIHGF